MDCDNSLTVAAALCKVKSLLGVLGADVQSFPVTGQAGFAMPNEVKHLA